MLTRGKLADQTGCNIETIRYYENIGLIPEPKRNASGYRSYDEAHLRLLHFIQRAKDLGFTADQIRSLIALSDDGDKHTRAEVKALTQSHIDGISRKISDLKKINSRLKQISSYCDGSSDSASSCPILISLFDS